MRSARTSTWSARRSLDLPRRWSASSRSARRRAGRGTSRARTRFGRISGAAASRWRTRKTESAGAASRLLGQSGPDLPRLRVVVVARNRHRVLAEQNQLECRVADSLLAVDVVRRVEPCHERTWPKLLLVEDHQAAFVVVVPVAVAVSPLDHAGDSPRAVVVHRSLFLRRELSEHEGEAVG